MKINSVKQKVIIEINGIEYIRGEMDYTESVQQAQESGLKIESEKDIFDWIEIN